MSLQLKQGGHLCPLHNSTAMGTLCRLESLKFLRKQRIVTLWLLCSDASWCDTVLSKRFCDSGFLKGEMQRRNFFGFFFLLVAFWLLLNGLPRLAFLMLCFLQKESFALTGCRTYQKHETKTNWKGFGVVLEENSFR